MTIFVMIFELESCPLDYFPLDLRDPRQNKHVFSCGKLINIIRDNINITDTCISGISDTCIGGLPMI